MKPEPSKWLPILFSMVAIGISCLSWWEAHRGRIIQEGINRPQLRVDRAELLRVDRVELPTEPLAFFEFNLKNVGKIPATITKLTFTPRVIEINGHVVDPCGPYQVSVDNSKPISFDMSKLTEILPGDDQHLQEAVLTQTGCKSGQVIEGKLDATYHSSITGENYTQSTDITVRVLEPSITIIPSAPKK